jgi:GTP-binding protein LepA
MEILLMSTNTRHPVERVGVFTPKAESKEYLGPGEIGFIVTGSKISQILKLEIR